MISLETRLSIINLQPVGAAERAPVEGRALRQSYARCWTRGRVTAAAHWPGVGAWARS